MENNLDKNNPADNGPAIPASQSLPEITVRGIILGVILTVILAAANAYLGLRVGQTVSASIPAAIISMSILRFFRNSNMLENTMVQTMASVGESLIAGITFVMPALIILHVWTGFYYWQTVCIALTGGILGVLFTVPLRRALLLDKTLKYPEGFAISNVLKANAGKETTSMKTLTWGGLIGALVSLFQTGFEILTDTFSYWVHTSKTLVGFNLGFSPALIAAGYIVGINVAISFAIGIAIGWLAGAPFLAWFYGIPAAQNPNDAVMSIYQEYIRYVGVGTMLIGALWTLCTLFKPISASILASFASLRTAKLTRKNLRTERDIPINYVLRGILLLIIPIFILLSNYIVPMHEGVTSTFHYLVCSFSTLYILIGGFLFCSISAYFAGLIGSSNTPVSGLLVSSLLILCLCLLAFFGLQNGIKGHETLGIILAIGSSMIICVALAISNDTMQDLKVGHVLGATPWKQQLVLVVGVIVASFVVPPILDLLYNAYGIGGVFPHPGMNKTQMLAAPQAGLMATVAQGVYTHNLKWSMICLGAVIAVICIIIDEILRKQFGARLPVLAVGLGIYLPMYTTTPIVIGGFLSYIIQLRLNKMYNHRRAANDKKMDEHQHRGLMLACGMVAGASVMGVVLAIPFALKKSSDALKLMPDQYASLAGVLSIVVTVVLCGWIYRVVLKKAP